MLARGIALAVLVAAPAVAEAQQGSAPAPANAPVTITQDGAGPGPGTPPAALFQTLDPAAPLASGLIELEVVNGENKRVGEIEDLALEGPGRVRSVIIAVGSRLGGAAKHVAVEPSSLRLTRTAAGKWQAVMTVTADQLQAAPGVPYKSGWSE